MKQSACSAVICQPGGCEQKHDICIVQMLAITRMGEQWIFNFFAQRDNTVADPGFPVGGRGPHGGAWTPEAATFRKISMSKWKNWVL